MSKTHTCGLDELFELFEDSLSPSDVLAAKLMSQISTAITKERIKLGMNQKEFAEYIDATQSLISRWEHGDYNFSIKKIAEIATKLNLDVNISMPSLVSYNTIDENDYFRMFPQTYTTYYSEGVRTKTMNKAYRSKINSKSISIQCR